MSTSAGLAFSTPKYIASDSDIPMVAPGSVGPLGAAARPSVQQLSKPAVNWNCADAETFPSWDLVVLDALHSIGGNILSLPRPSQGDVFLPNLSKEETLSALSAAQAEYDQCNFVCLLNVIE